MRGVFLTSDHIASRTAANVLRDIGSHIVNHLCADLECKFIRPDCRCEGDARSIRRNIFSSFRNGSDCPQFDFLQEGVLGSVCDNRRAGWLDRTRHLADPLSFAWLALGNREISIVKRTILNIELAWVLLHASASDPLKRSDVWVLEQ